MVTTRFDGDTMLRMPFEPRLVRSCLTCLRPWGEDRSLPGWSTLAFSHWLLLLIACHCSSIALHCIAIYTDASAESLQSGMGIISLGCHHHHHPPPSWCSSVAHAIYMIYALIFCLFLAWGISGQMITGLILCSYLSSLGELARAHHYGASALVSG